MKFIYDSINLGRPVISIFLDFKKAFDCVSHDILLSKLNFYGIRGIALNWFKSYLSDRKQYTMINNTSSQLQNITHGVPQGSILGPLLFLIFINDLPNSSNLFKYTLFADDSTLSVDFENKNLPSFVIRLNKELKNVNNWLCANKISINIIKTKYIIFSLRISIKLRRVVKIGNGKIKSADNIKFLGVFIDKNLKFNVHINYLSAKISRSVGLLYKLNKFLPQSALLKIYYSLIHPYFNYAMETWFNINQYSSNKLVVLQKKAMRAIFNEPYNSHSTKLFKNCNTLKLYDLYNLKIAIYMFKSINMNYDANLFSSLIKSSSMHTYPIRNNDEFRVPRILKNKCKNNIKIMGPKVWNSIPKHLRNKKNKFNFQKLLKLEYLSKY